jgi:alpha-tubulin suppressor-like RCC1 family protein
LNSQGENRVQPEPVQVIGLDGDVLDLALGGAHGCAIQNSEVWCWGQNGHGQVGNGDGGEAPDDDPKHVNKPVKISMPDGKDAVDVEAGFYHTCALLKTDELACWGRNDDGQLGDGTFQGTDTPKIVYP